MVHKWCAVDDEQYTIDDGGDGDDGDNDSFFHLISVWKNKDI